MAIAKDVTFKGIKIKNAYCRISRVDLAKTSMEVYVEFKADADSPGFDSLCYPAPYDISAGNPIEQGYTFLKTLPDFTGAKDC